VRVQAQHQINGQISNQIEKSQAQRHAIGIHETSREKVAFVNWRGAKKHGYQIIQKNEGE